MNGEQSLSDILAGMDAADDGAAAATTTGTTTTEPTEPTETTEATETPDETKKPETPPQENEEAQKQNAAFARFRTENARYKQLIDRVTTKYGVQSVEELEAALNQEALEADAKKMNMSPEAAKRMAELEAKTNQATMEMQRQLVVGKLTQVQNTLGLKDDQLRSFVEQLRDNQIDVINSQVPLDVYYKAFNYDTMLKQELNKAKEEWVKSSTKQTSSSGTIKGAGKGEPAGKEVASVRELSAILKEM